MSGQQSGSIIVPSLLFDQGTIISFSGGDAGFPVENLQDPQPRRKWRVTDAPPFAAHFVIDLGTSTQDTLYNSFAALFHAGRPNLDKWRIQSGSTTAGTGSYDSGVISLWPAFPHPAPGSYKSSRFYQPPGSHSWHVLQQAQGEFATWLIFGGAATDFVNFGAIAGMPAAPPGYSIGVRVQLNGSGPNQMILCKGASSVGQGSFQGYYVGVGNDGFARCGLGNGTALGTFNLTSGPSPNGFIADGKWHDIVMRYRFNGDLNLFVDGAVLSSVAAGILNTNTGANLRLGISNSSTQPLDGSIERAIIIQNGTSSQDDVTDAVFGYMSSLTPQAVVPFGTTVLQSALKEGQGTVIHNAFVGGGDGTINGNVTWAQPPSLLQDRYVRIDFTSDTLNFPFTMGRFFIGRSLSALVPAPAEKPTPLGSPARNKVSWRVVMDREKFESVAFALAQRSGSNPRTLRSWGHDTFLLDGARTIVSCNNVLAPDAWSRHQQTVYGYVDSLSPVKVRGDLHEADITIQGI